MIPPASLRSDRDRHRVGISARDQIGITDRLRRNQQIQRFRCKSCGATFSEDRPKPLGNHYVDFDEAIQVLSLLLEGMSIRAASRVTGLHKRTIMSLLILAGEKAQAVLDIRVQRVRSRYVQMDELWSFVH